MSPFEQGRRLPPIPSPNSDLNTNLCNLLQRSLSQGLGSPPLSQHFHSGSQQLSNDIHNRIRSDIPVIQSNQPPYSQSLSHISPTLSISSSDLARPINMLPLTDNLSIPPGSALCDRNNPPPPKPERPARKPRARKASTAARGRQAKRPRGSSRAAATPLPRSTLPLPGPPSTDAARLDLENSPMGPMITPDRRQVSSLGTLVDPLADIDPSLDLSGFLPLNPQKDLTSKFPASDQIDDEDHVGTQSQVS